MNITQARDSDSSYYSGLRVLRTFVVPRRVHPALGIVFLVACFPAVTRAGVVITLEATPPTIYPPVGYVNGEVARVDVYAQLDADSPQTIRLRMAQFDLSDSSNELGISPLLMRDPYEGHPGIPFWNLPYRGPCCEECNCGIDYFVDGSLTDPTPDMLSIIYTGLTSSGNFQITLRQSNRILLGSFDVTMPSIDGYFDLDVLNADESDTNLGADFRSGFGSTADPIMRHWTAREGTVTGGHIRFRVGFAIPEPATLALLLFGTVCITPRLNPAVAATSRCRTSGSV